ncbi:MAG: CDP-alcohol phosphatidyltransferase family protein [Rhodomicrobium sp.]
MSNGSQPGKFKVLGAAAVHVFTAAGGALGLFALLSASNGQWAASFAWLGAALFVDGADGPLARAVEVKRVLPRFSGEDLDKIVDYLTYVTVPAFMVARGPIVPEGLRLPFAAAIMLVSLYHFSDQESKTPDGYFVGFPAIWNAVVLYCFVLAIPPVPAAVLIGVCAFLTFIPFRFVHPLRVRRLRPLTLAVILVWSGAAAASVAQGFPGNGVEQVIFVLAAAYLVALGLTAAK